MKILLLPGSENSPAARVRIWQFVEPLVNEGHEVTVRCLSPDRHCSPKSKNKVLRFIEQFLITMRRLVWVFLNLNDTQKFDVVMMNKDVLPEMSIRWIEPRMRRKKDNLVFDFDDAIFHGRRNEKLKEILPSFNRVFAGNAYLAEYAKKYLAEEKITIVPTVVDTGKLNPPVVRETGPIRIGWSGSTATIVQCLPLLRSVMEELAKTEDFEFIVIAEVNPRLDWQGVNVRYIPWTKEAEAEGLQTIDIGLMPLKDEPFEKGKCGLKALQYMAVGAVPVVSPVGVNKQIVEHGVNGFHAKSDEEWISFIKELVKDSLKRQQFGESARQAVIKNYSVDTALTKMNRVFQQMKDICQN